LPKKRSDAPPDACETALRLLARREHSRVELAGKLARRDIDGADIDAALDRLEAEGALSEARFVEQLVRTRLRQGYGPLRIRRDLAAKGVDPETTDNDMPFDDDEWSMRAEAARSRRFGDVVPTERHERARQARFLERRGYAAAHIVRALSG
jgi:regulatory protein